MVTRSAGSITGTKDAVEQLRALGALEDGKVLRLMVNAGAKPFTEAARAAAPERTTDAGGELRKTYKGRYVGPGFAKHSIHAASILARNKQSAAAFIGPSKEGFYLGFVELGTSKNAPHPWLLGAFNAAKDAAVNAAITNLRRSVVRIAKKKGGA